MDACLDMCAGSHEYMRHECIDNDYSDHGCIGHNSMSSTYIGMERRSFEYRRNRHAVGDAKIWAMPTRTLSPQGGDMPIHDHTQANIIAIIIIITTIIIIIIIIIITIIIHNCASNMHDRRRKGMRAEMIVDRWLGPAKTEI